MSNGFYDEVDEDTPLVKQLRERGDKAEKRVKELEDKLNELSGQVKKSTVADVLKAKGVNPALSRFILNDIEGDATPEAVEAWIKDNGELFGLKVDAEPEAAQEPTPTDPRVAEQAAAQQRIAAVEQGAPPIALGEDALLQKLNDPSLTPQELFQLLGRTDGNNYYPQAHA